MLSSNLKKLKKAPDLVTRFLGPVGILAALMLLSVALSGCSGQAAPPDKEAARPVKVITVVAGESDFRNHYPGLVKASREVNLSFRVPGRLIKLPVKAGQLVKKNQLVAQLDKRDYRLRADQAKAAFEEAKAQYQRYKRLIASKAISKSTLDRHRSLYLTTKAAYEESLAAKSDTNLKAPFSGVVARTLVKNYQAVSAQQAIISLQDISNLEVEVQVPENHIIMIQLYKSPRLFVSFEALPDREFQARLKEIPTQADSATQTFGVTVVLPRPAGVNVLPGMTAELRVLASKVKENAPAAVKVPVEAVLADKDKRSAVWVVDTETSTVHLVRVELGTLSGDSISIISGLTAGDTVVVAGVYHLSEGMKVRVPGRTGQGNLK